MEFKRMDEVEGVIVPYDFEFAWDRISASSMNEETTCVTHIGHSFIFFAQRSQVNVILFQMAVNGWSWTSASTSMVNGKDPHLM